MVRAPINSVSVQRSRDQAQTSIPTKRAVPIVRRTHWQGLIYLCVAHILVVRLDGAKNTFARRFPFSCVRQSTSAVLREAMPLNARAAASKDESWSEVDLPLLETAAQHKQQSRLCGLSRCSQTWLKRIILMQGLCILVLIGILVKFAVNMRTLGSELEFDNNHSLVYCKCHQPLWVRGQFVTNMLRLALRFQHLLIFRRHPGMSSSCLACIRKPPFTLGRRLRDRTRRGKSCTTHVSLPTWTRPGHHR